MIVMVNLLFLHESNSTEDPDEIELSMKIDPEGVEAKVFCLYFFIKQDRIDKKH